MKTYLPKRDFADGLPTDEDTFSNLQNACIKHNFDSSNYAIARKLPIEMNEMTRNWV